jgi:AcrR family transcriptional regulator
VEVDAGPARPVARRPGGRSARVRTAVLSATVDRLSEAGWAGMSIDAIAARARVHKTTIYRRWPTLEALALDALITFASSAIPIPDCGSVRGDLRLLLDEIAATITSAPGRAFVNTMRGGAGDGDDPFAQLLREFWRRRFARAGEIVRRGIARGELSASVDADLVVEALTAPLYFRVFISGASLDREFLDSLVDLVVPRVS